MGKVWRLRAMGGLLFAVCAAAIGLLFAHPSEAAAGAREGLLLCGQVIIPSLFPFAVLALFAAKSGLLRAVGRVCTPVSKMLFAVNGEVFGAVLLSCIGGYPVGARLLRELAAQKRLSERQAGLILCYAVNAGPAFVVLAVGAGILHSRQLGFLLLFSHLGATLLLGVGVGLFLRATRQAIAPCEEAEARRPALSDAFVEATADAASAVFGICAWVVLFSTVQALLHACGLPEALRSVCDATLEVTNAVLASRRHYVRIAAILGWAGLCVHCQVLAASGQIRPRYAKFCAFRLAHAGLSAGLFALLLRAFPQAVPTLAGQTGFVVRAGSASAAASCGLLLLCLVALFSLGDRRPRKFL